MFFFKVGMYDFLSNSKSYLKTVKEYCLCDWEHSNVIPWQYTIAQKMGSMGHSHGILQCTLNRENKIVHAFTC